MPIVLSRGRNLEFFKEVKVDYMLLGFEPTGARNRYRQV